MLAAIRAFFSRLARLVRRDRAHASIDEELQCHLEMEIAENLRQGLSPEEARRRALIALGGLQQTKEEYRETWALRWLGTLAQDLRYAVRGVRRSSGFTVTLVLVLALGISASSVMFTVVDRLLLNPVPFPNARRMIWFPLLGGASKETLDYWGGQNHAFEKVALYSGGAVGLSVDRAGERIQVARATVDLFSILGVQTLFGRTFSTDEQVTGNDKVVILSYSFWKHIGADRGILGRTLKLHNLSHEVIGVMPPDCRFPPQTDVWVPMAFGPGRRALEFDVEPSAKYEGGQVGLLRPGATLEQAQVEHRLLWDRFVEEGKRENPRYSGGSFQPLVPLEQRLSRGFVVPVVALFGAVLCFLAITCANAASLLLAHAAARQKEISVRVCLGASRARILRQLLTEGLLLTFTSGLCGVLLALWAVQGLRVVGGSHIPRLADIALNGNALAFALGVTLLTGLLLGFAPAVQSVPPDLSRSLKMEGNRAGGTVRQRLRKSLVVVQIALALVLAVVAGLMLRSLYRSLNLDKGFITERVLTARVALPAAEYADHQQRGAYWASLQAELIRLPGVVASGMTDSVPLEEWQGLSLDLGRSRGQLTRYVMAERKTIAGDYFGAMGIRLLGGRIFTEHDGPNAPKTMIICESLARAAWPNQNPMGAQIRIEGEDGMREIIGVAGNVDTLSLRFRQRQGPQFYLPYSQPFPPSSPVMVNLIVRTSGDPEAIVPALQKLVLSLHPEARLYQARRMDEVLSDVIAGPRFNTMLLVGFGLAALLLAALGVYGVVSYSVACRRHEIGVRVSLGAQRHDILRLVLGEGARLGIIGVLAGLLGALALTQLISSLLFRVEATDPLSFAAASACLLAAVFAASLIPARRATRLDPLVALRHE
jgi:putative ABC transport system permease protein